MKKYISLLFAVLLLASSCKDIRYDNMINNSAYFPKSDLQEHTVTVMSASDYVYNIWVYKAGYFQTEFAGSVGLDYNYLVSYNVTNGTEYSMLDEKYYSFDRDFIIGVEDIEVAVPLTLKTETILTDFGYGTFYIPFEVVSKTPDEEIYSDKSNFLLALTLQQPILGIDGFNKGEILLDLSNGNWNTYDVDITAALDVESSEDLEISYREDISLVPEKAKKLDAQYYSYEATVILAQGERYAENYLELNVTAIPDGRWTLPVRMTTQNEKVQMAEDAYLLLTVIKGILNAVEWDSYYLQGNEIIVPGESITDVLIGTISGITAEISSDVSWAQAKIEDDKIYMSVEENPDNSERMAVITVTDTETLLEKSIPITQAISGFGVVVNKNTWSTPVFSSNCANKESSLYLMYDGKWRKNAADTNSFVELNDRADDPSVPFVITFDFGAIRTFNSFGLMPRQQWTQPAPKKIKLEVSEDMENWITVGENQNSDGTLPGFTQDELMVNGSYENVYNGKVKWFDFEERVEKRYLRLSLYEGWYGNGNVICIEEVFASLR